MPGMPRANAVLLDGERWHRVRFDRVATPAGLEEVLHTPKAVPLGLFSGLEFWSPGDAGEEPNAIAGLVLRALMDDAAEGLYMVPDTEWHRAQAFAANPDTLPAVYGRCVLTGTGEVGRVAPLPDRFARWWGQNRDRITSRSPKIKVVS